MGLKLENDKSKGRFFISATFSFGKYSTYLFNDSVTESAGAHNSQETKSEKAPSSHFDVRFFDRMDHDDLW